MSNYYFNFPPENSLTLAQRSAVNYPYSIALSGGPGTGKSFVSLWRHIINHTKNSESRIRSQLLTFTTTLAFYLKATSREQSMEASQYVDSTQNWFYRNSSMRDEIIVDEAQDMPYSFYINGLNRFTTKLSYGADDKQILQANAIINGKYNLNVCTPEKALDAIYHNRKFILDRNYRNSKRILIFAKTAFQQAVIPQNEVDSCQAIGELPTILIGNQDEQIKAIREILKAYNQDGHNIAILTPLASIPWNGGEVLTARYYYEILKNEFDISYYDTTQHNGQGLNEMKNIHITPFKSAKGLEFDTVIIPSFNFYDFDFRVISWKDFFVGITRTKSNLFLLSDRDLPILNNVAEVTYLNSTN